MTGNGMLAVGVVCGLVFSLAAPGVAAGSPERSASIGASVLVGLSAPPDPEVWSLPSTPDLDVQSRPAYAVALSYGPMPLVSEALLFVSTEVSHTCVETDEEPLQSCCCGLAYEGTGHMSLSMTGIMLRARVAGPSRLSPFVEFGLGAARVHFVEEYSWDYLRDIDFGYWGFAYGAGAGLQFDINPTWRVTGLLQSRVVPGEKLKPRTESGETGIYGDAMGYIAGVRLEISM